jgi:hypothetical protein
MLSPSAHKRGSTMGPRRFRGIFAKWLKVFGVPDGIRTRVTAVKGRCPNRWTTGTHSLRNTELV